MTPSIEDANDLSDIKTHFYAIVERYPAVYANHKANPHLPAAMMDNAKMEANLTALHRRMFAFQARVEKETDQHESNLHESTNANMKLNAMMAKRTANIDSSDAIIAMREPFTGRQLPGCNSDYSNCPCVDPNESSCSSKCKEVCPATANQISMVAEARDIERTAYTYSIARIVYLVVGIAVISYFILQTVGSSTIMEDAKLKAAQLTNRLYTQPAEQTQPGQTAAHPPRQ
jgi:hypothetical protein